MITLRILLWLLAANKLKLRGAGRNDNTSDETTYRV